MVRGKRNTLGEWRDAADVMKRSRVWVLEVSPEVDILDKVDR